MKTLTREQVRQVDRIAIEEFGIPGSVLMENAGRGVADVMCDLGIRGRVVICCGKGNNAGDGFVIARHLDLRGYETTLFCLATAEELVGDARINYQIAVKSDLAIEHFDASFGDWARLVRTFESSDWVVDAMLGTGAQGTPRPPFSEAIASVNSAKNVKKMAVDIPSGLDCDTGELQRPTLKATHTCTFVASKPGLLVPAAAEHVGILHVINIGVPRKLLNRFLGS